MSKRDKPIEGGKAILTRHCAVLGERRVAVRKFKVCEPQRPWAQYPVAVTILFAEPGRLKWRDVHVVPDNRTYWTIEQSGRIVYDTREDVPLDKIAFRQVRDDMERRRDARSPRI